MTTVSIIPTLIDTLVTQSAAALPSVRVYDGFGVSEDPGDFLMIGVDDPDAPTPANVATSQQDWVTMRTAPSTRDEQGEITCAALSWNGDGDAGQKAARDAAFATCAAVSTLIRNDPTLGLSPSVLWTRFGSSLQLTQQQGAGGAQALVIFQIAFRARI